MIPTDGLAAFGGDLPTFYEEQAGGVDVHVSLDEDHTLHRSGTHSTINLLGARNAAAQLDRLPDEDETIHGIMRGNFAGFDFVPAVLRLADGATIAELNIATLGFKDCNTDALLELIDTGQVGRVTFIASHFYRSHEGEVFARLHDELQARGGRCLAMRCHAKLLMFELTDSRGYAMEMSANLRGCNNLEQFALTRSIDLVEFHRGWMLDALDQGGE